HHGLVRHPTPFCSQRTNRCRANQREPILNNAFASRSRRKRRPEERSDIRTTLTPPRISWSLSSLRQRNCVRRRARIGATRWLIRATLYLIADDYNSLQNCT